jgi:hypothetical protein
MVVSGPLGCGMHTTGARTAMSLISTPGGSESRSHSSHSGNGKGIAWLCTSMAVGWTSAATVGRLSMESSRGSSPSTSSLSNSMFAARVRLQPRAFYWMELSRGPFYRMPD